MAGFFQQFLGGVAQGFAGNPNLRDFTHASKTFTTNAFGNSPKYKWLFHVYFDINKDAVAPTNTSATFPDTSNYGLLVKSISLPKFNLNLTELNQYNRKRYVQTKINYDPVSISFHDDNLNQIKNLWTAYYNYYYWDASVGGLSSGVTNQPGSVASQANITNIYDNNIADQQNWGYNGIPTGTTVYKVPFFKSIRIYGFNQHNYAGYELINPIIDNFEHDTYSYYETNTTMENSMRIRYETVSYFQGAINGENPTASVDGFGEEGVYDRRRSPITNPGSTRSILGQGGLADSASNIYDNLAKGNILGAAQTALRTANTFKNPAAILNAAKSEVAAGVIGAARTLKTPVFPSYGAGQGAGSQQQRASNVPAGTATPPIIP